MVYTLSLYIFTTYCWYKNSHNGDFTLVLLKIFDVHLVFCRFLKTYFSTILQFCGRSPVKSTKVRSLIFLPCIPYSTVSAMMLFKHDSFYMKIFIDDWSCYNIWKNENNSSQLLFDNKFCKGLNKNSIIALNNTSVNHDKQKRRKHFFCKTSRKIMHTYFHRKAGCHGYDYANEMKLYSWSSFPTRHTSWKFY